MNGPAPIKIIPSIISIKNTQEHKKVELESVLLTEKSMALQNINNKKNSTGWMESFVF